AEVVSRMELDLARSLGVPFENVIFNGPHKPPDALEPVLAAGGTVNIDHTDEIGDLERVAEMLGRPVKVGLRLNLDAGIYPQWTRFGFNLENGQALDAVKRLSKSRRLVLSGLHCHLGTFISDPRAYGRQVEKMVRFGLELEASFGLHMEFYDVGGGFASRNQLKGTYLPPDVAVPPIDEYAEQITDALWRNLPPGSFPKLIVESGRALVDEAGSLITTVWAVKRLADGTRAYVADAGVNLLFTSFWYRFAVALDRPAAGPNEPCVIYGPLCMNIDVLHDLAMLPPLSRGTRLIFSPVGAYNTTQWLQFIEYRPRVVLIGEDGSVDVIRESESLEDVFRQDRLPSRLAPRATASPPARTVSKRAEHLARASTKRE
ncbi:MAG: alanine racemase, partial [Candidatus Riflebacteria bacterium]|nr:alanine racemase [Candidatus Riflebacteria bacterium]